MPPRKRSDRRRFAGMSREDATPESALNEAIWKTIAAATSARRAHAMT